MTATNPRTAPTLLFAATLTIMAGATIAPALPAMVEHFGHETKLRVQLLMTITALAIAVSAPIAGLLGDTLGRVRVLWVSVALYVLAGGAGLILSSLELLTASRVLLGLAVAGIMTSVGALIGDLYQGPERDRMLGMQGAAMGFGGVVFLGFGGALASLGWRGPFLIYLLPLALLVLIPMALEHHTGQSVESRPLKANDPPAPIPKRLLYALMSAAFLGMVGFYAVPVQLPFLLAERGQNNPMVSGGMMAALTLVSALVGVFYGQFTRRFPVRVLGLGAFGALAAGFLTIWAAHSLIWLGLGLIGVGMGLLMPTLSRWLLGNTSPELRGRVMGMLTSALFAGQFTSPLILALITRAQGSQSAFGSASLISFLALLCLVGFHETKKDQTSE